MIRSLKLLQQLTDFFMPCNKGPDVSHPFIPYPSHKFYYKNPYDKEYQLYYQYYPDTPEAWNTPSP